MKIARVSVSIAAGTFWGFLVSVAFKLLFRLSDDASFFFICLPVAAALTLFFFKKLPDAFSSKPERQ
jgi:hypothetical protein